jgi:hypothetical protein
MRVPYIIYFTPMFPGTQFILCVKRAHLQINAHLKSQESFPQNEYHLLTRLPVFFILVLWW